MINDISQERYAQLGGDPGQTLDILEGLQLPPNPQNIRILSVEEEIAACVQVINRQKKIKETFYSAK